MTLTIQLFAASREIVGQPTLEVSLPDGGTVEQLRKQIAQSHPRLQSLLARSAIAVNQDFAEETRPLSPGDELAIIPPVSGG